MTETDKDDLVVRLRHPAWTTNPSGESIFAAGQAIAEMSEAAAEIERLRLQLAKARNDALEEAARIARDGCLVPPDGGSPTETENEMCEGIATNTDDVGETQ